MRRFIIAALVPLLLFATSVWGQENNLLQEPTLPGVKPIFFILGCLDEYRGRGIIEKGADGVESFYSSEVQASKVFEKYLRLLVAEESIHTEIRKEISDGGHISFHSSELCQHINSMYQYSFDNSHTMVKPHKYPNGPYVRMVEAFISIDVFKGQDKTAKLSYLAGAYARYGHHFDDNNFAFRTANAGHKISLIAELLKELDCKDVTHEKSDPNLMPMTHTLKFTASTEIKKLFESVSKEINGRDRREI
ncbi:hypothetical protein GEOBRER4_n3736 [Citrifermentans bremense]|uniref:Uncharacterized protein n=2 Tax=Citrifermentans bremense TaxID=60035 RepID=A0A7R7FSL2_9BACT|nr:hypothetical protein [Citrifermentans bremense]BCO11607.1 hypothetical protein GEOBRER4_n3736 [Citrifermentans bremense]